MELRRLQEVTRLVENGETVVIAQPLTREGAVPTPVGAFMIVHEDGTSGTVGGGVLEADAVAAARQILGSGQHLLLTRSMDASEATGDDMLCGGQITLLLESVLPQDAPVWLEAEEGVLRGEELVWRCVIVETDPPRVSRILLRIDHAGSADPGISAARATSIPQATRTSKGIDLIDPIVIPDTLLIFGAGHVAQALAPIASALGFRCVVVDDRAEYASPERFPTAHRLVVGDPAAAVASLPSGERVWAAVMTRGHKDDADVLAGLVRGRYHYIGMVGSTRKRAIIWRQLVAEGAPSAVLEGVHCPVGLTIGGTTPHEIAVSIAAELVAVRHGRHPVAPDSSGYGQTRMEIRSADAPPVIG